MAKAKHKKKNSDNEEENKRLDFKTHRVKAKNKTKRK
jgi:hypothetical protein